LVGRGSGETQRLIKGKLMTRDLSSTKAKRRAEPWPTIDHGSARF
jgi:hypothetical protein